MFTLPVTITALRAPHLDDARSRQAAACYPALTRLIEASGEVADPQEEGGRALKRVRRYVLKDLQPTASGAVLSRPRCSTVPISIETITPRRARHDSR
jgi:hypothetical protein